jgi:REP element-mobilizing transposase RayT
MNKDSDTKTEGRGQSLSRAERRNARATAGETPAPPTLAPQSPAPRRRFQPKYGEVKIRDRGYLPHWEAEGATYFVTFRLADSLPKSVRESYRYERNDIVLTAQRQDRQLSAAELKRLDELFGERIEAYLDSGSGACCLANPRIAGMVAEALQFFEGRRYRQFAWSVMPNHVHCVFRPLPNWPLDKIMHGWKSFTAKEADKILNRAGDFWESEYFDHVIRNEQEFHRYIEYVATNPQRAGLRDWKWVWVRSSLK